MGILHLLGLKKSFHGIFQGTPESEAIEILRANSHEFRIIIAFLENTESVINLKTLTDDENNRIEKSKKTHLLHAMNALQMQIKNQKYNECILMSIDAIQTLLLRH